MKKIISILTTIVILLPTSFLFAQEMIVPLTSNPVLFNKKNSTIFFKKTRAALPFIEDFTNDEPYPNPYLWVDSQAYINNTMSETAITQGMATLDGLNEFGRPYFTNPNSVGYADSLTSQPIDLTTYTPNNNLFFSFFYQPQGLGFAPETKDSLILFFKNNTNNWVEVWKTKGTTIQPFRYVLLALNDAQFFHPNFQFRFVNIASLDLNDDNWNIDYIKLDANRSYTDSINHDIAFTLAPTSFLSPYSSMPYRHFLANQSNEKAATQTVTISNLYNTNNSIILQQNATELISSTPITNSTLPTVSVPAYSTSSQNFNTYSLTYSAPTNYSKVILQNKYFFNQVNLQDRKENDTLKRNCVFDNYFAYDDGSAEKSYFLLAAPNFPAKTALAFHLNEADSLRGLMVHFGPQLPTALGKKFSIVLYKTLAGGTVMNDSIIIQQDLFTVQYENSINGFSSFAFENPIKLDAGNYFIGITQPANFGSDSIYYGLDVNTHTNAQYLYYNVDGTWYSSLTDGSLMMRPIVGQAFTPTIISDKTSAQKSILIYPNPTTNIIYFDKNQTIKSVAIYSVNGHLIDKQEIQNNQISIEKLPIGCYFLEIKNDTGIFFYQKINKQ